MQVLSKQYTREQLAILAISIIGSKKSTEAYLKSALMNQEVAYPVLMNGKTVQKSFKGRGVPNTFILDQKGKVRYRHRGFSDGMKKYLEMEIHSLLGAV